ncbi:MAG: asparagine synthase (glutamine-hydrolyzing) [Alphaproteobacteria bacterium]|jgi:asparagine synthase (glutamine-hydrolysing)|nr:asparagine synthase (glutamine-hydrolyzing) [Alphaproteobacteria bacterium]
MCGIAGFITPGLTNALTLMRITSDMTNAIRHRGPDDEGAWVDESAGLALGHRRLSIQDLSPAGHQPMISHCGRWVMVYNGETYSNKELRPLLEAQGIVFRGHSDTEVMVEAIAAWGVEASVKQFNGKFAFALWDRKEHHLYLVRDRLGIKPLYWGISGSSFLFGSELKALCAYPDFHPKLNLEALAGYLKHAYVPTPLSIYKEVHKLPPGTILCRTPDGQVNLKAFWTLEDAISQGLSSLEQNPDPSPQNALEDLEDLLNDAVTRRMISDVPLGTFLSGGIDSSLVTAIAARHSPKPIQTFTIGFAEKEYNEAPYAKAIATYLGTDHTELMVTPRQALDVIPNLPHIYDEPFADSSQIPTFLVSQLARQSVTVGLSGDGGDEVFAGYSRYMWGNTMWKTMRNIPFRSSFANLLTLMPPTGWNILSSLIPASKRPAQLGHKMHKLARCMKAKTSEALYESLISYWAEPSEILPHHYAPNMPRLSPHFNDFVSKMQALDTLTYLPDDILTKVDRASMSVGLEVRVPLLDHRVVEWAWAQPTAFKTQGRSSKWLLRQLLYKHVPQDLIDRPKSGFAVPIDTWLRGPLRDWAEDLMNPTTLMDTFDPGPIRALWKAHLEGRADHKEKLWSILMFEAWRRNTRTQLQEPEVKRDKLFAHR